MPVSVESTPFLPGLSPVLGKKIEASFDGGDVSSDAGVLVLKAIEERLRLSDRLAECLRDPRDPDRVAHTIAEIIRFRTLMIAAGYEDGNDADALRSDSVFKLALGRLPSGDDLCSQPTISRLENLPQRRDLVRMAKAMVDIYCGSFAQVPKRIVLDIDDTFDAAHGTQQLSFFNAHYDERGFQPIVVFDDDGRPVTAVLRPAKTPSGVEAATLLRHLFREIRETWPRIDILVRGDSHYARPEVVDLCRRERIDFIFGLHPTAPLLRHVAGLERQIKAAFEAGPKTAKLRRFTDFYDAPSTWSRVERVIARCEIGPQGPDTRLIVTNLEGRPRRLYEDLYCRRGEAENRIKAWKTHLAADRTSCSAANANQFRLFLHTAAYWLMWSLRALTPRRSSWRIAQFDTLRLKLLKIGARIVELRKKIRLHLPTTMPHRAILRSVLDRLPKLVFT
jgi:hypothetical protein